MGPTSATAGTESPSGATGTSRDKPIEISDDPNPQGQGYPVATYGTRREDRPEGSRPIVGSERERRLKEYGQRPYNQGDVLDLGGSRPAAAYPNYRRETSEERRGR